LSQVQGRRVGRETFRPLHDWRKALKGKAQECWELKEASEGAMELTPSRG